MTKRSDRQPARDSPRRDRLNLWLLAVSLETGERRWCKVGGEPLLIGRRSSTDGAGKFSLDFDPTLSRSHLTVHLQTGILHVRHSLNKHPLYLNGQEKQEFTLEPGQFFTTGRTRFELIEEEAPPQAEERSFSLSLEQAALEQDASRCLRALLGLQSLLSQSAEPRSLFEGLTPLLRQIMPTSSDILALQARSSDSFEILAVHASGERVPAPSRTLVSAALAKREPVVYVWSDQPPEAATEPVPTMTEGAIWALAAPIPVTEDEAYVLYAVGKEPHPDTLRPGGDTPTALDQSALALVSQVITWHLAGRRTQRVQLQLEYERQERDELQQWVERLGVILEGSRAIASTLDPQILLDRLEERMATLVPHEVHVIWMSARNGAILERHWADGADREWRADEEAKRQILFAVLEARRPLLVENLRDAGYGLLAPGLQSLLAVPMLSEQEPVGAIALSCSSKAAFSQDQRDSLFILAFQAASAFRNAELHQSLLEMHRALAESQAQVVQSSKLAAVGRLAAGVAHELNSPLGAVLLGLEAGLETLVSHPDTAIRKLETAHKAAVRARSIIQKLLLYSRASQGEQRPLSLNTVVEDVLELLGEQMEKDGIEICSNLVDVPQVMGDQSELHQVVTNLVLNARDAVIAEGPHLRELRIRTCPRDCWVIVEVEDFGGGIPPQIQERIFDPFFTTKPVGKGTGLGLSVSQQIMTKHGGSLLVHSAPGESTVFTMQLPALHR